MKTALIILLVIAFTLLASAIILTIVLVAKKKIYERNSNNKIYINYSDKYETEELNTQEYKYVKKKNYMTANELYFMQKINNAIANTNLICIPQVNLATIVEKQGYYKYRNELFRNIDFCIFTKNNYEIKLAIEINDNTHNEINRIERDIKVQNILEESKIPLIILKSSKQYTTEFIKEQILQRI